MYRKGTFILRTFCENMEIEDEHNTEVITVNVHDSFNMERIKMKTKLQHEEFPWLYEQQIPVVTSDARQGKQLPVRFETSKMRISNDILEDLFPVNRSISDDFGTINATDTLEKKTQGHIVFHPSGIDFTKSLIQDQEEYLNSCYNNGDKYTHVAGDKIAGNVGGKTESENKMFEELGRVGKDSSELNSWPLPVSPMESIYNTDEQTQKNIGKEVFIDDMSKPQIDLEKNMTKTVEYHGAYTNVPERTMTEPKQAGSKGSNKTVQVIDSRVETEQNTTVNTDGDSLYETTESSLTTLTRPVTKRNSRYCGRKKAPAYRPGTSLDNFRHNITHAIDNINAELELDTTEGHKIWEEVDTMIKHSIPNGSLWKSKRELHTSPIRSWDKSKHPFELRRRFERTGSETSHFIPIDHMWDIEMEPDTFVNDFIVPMQHESTFDRVYGKPVNDLEDQTSAEQYRKKLGGNFFSESDGESFENESAKKDTYDSSKGKQEFGQEQKRTVTFVDDGKGMKEGKQGISNTPLECDFVKIHLIHPVLKSGSAPTPSIHLLPGGACKTRTMMVASTLPRLTPSSTPLPTGITQQPPRSHSSASLYVPYPPKDLSSSMDYMKMPQRINPLKPPPPRKRINWSWETVDQHHENEKRRLLMQKREHTRYHSAWSKAFYGAPAEKEAYRRHYREVLKQQMDDRDSMKKDDFKSKVKESERALAYDKQCQINDSNEFFRKHNYLMQYRDGNKQQMEDRWAQVRYNKHMEDRIDRERLRYNPINWSCSLK